MGRWIGRVVGRMVARLHWWWSEGRTVGKLISERLNRRLVLVGKVMHNLRRRMNKWMVQRMGWSFDVRILNQIFNMMLRVRWMLRVMGNNSR